MFKIGDKVRYEWDCGVAYGTVKSVSKEIQGAYNVEWDNLGWSTVDGCDLSLVEEE